MTWTPRRKVSIALAVAGALVVLGGLGWYFFAPKPTQERADAAPQGELLKMGQFENGETFHEASGTVSLLRVDGKLVLRFEDYAATSGPDVYVYLTPEPRPTTTAHIEGDGVKVRTPTAMGQATWRGDFNLDVPEGVDAARYGGIAIWCDTYNVLFGFAELDG